MLEIPDVEGGTDEDSFDGKSFGVFGASFQTGLHILSVPVRGPVYEYNQAFTHSTEISDSAVLLLLSV